MISTAPKRRGRRPHEEGRTLSRQQLLDGLLALAAREGEAALNMRRIAAELDVSPRLLYYHVQNKDELFDLLADAITARCQLPAPELPWQQRLLAIQCALREEILKYPGVSHRALVRSTERFDSPHASHVAVEMRRALRDAGLSSAQVEQAYAALHAYFMGHVMLAEAQASAHRAAGHGAGVNLPELGANFESGLRYLLAGIAASAEAGPSEQI